MFHAHNRAAFPAAFSIASHSRSYIKQRMCWLMNQPKCEHSLKFLTQICIAIFQQNAKVISIREDCVKQSLRRHSPSLIHAYVLSMLEMRSLDVAVIVANV